MSGLTQHLATRVINACKIGELNTKISFLNTKKYGLQVLLEFIDSQKEIIASSESTNAVDTTRAFLDARHEETYEKIVEINQQLAKLQSDLSDCKQTGGKKSRKRNIHRRKSRKNRKTKHRR